VLDSLICEAYRQNVALPVAEMQALPARAELTIDTGNLLPLAEARRAQEMSASGHIRDKIVLKVAASARPS
jgi:hypothetical protein